jgi:enoyl-CoA hydratase
VTETLRLDRPRAGVVVLQLNRPKYLNAINDVMRRELTESLTALAADASTNAVVLTGAGRGFCSGIDMRDFGPEIPDAADPAIDRLRFQEAMAALPQAIWNLPQPVVAAVNGPASARESRCALPPTSGSAPRRPHSATRQFCSGCPEPRWV